MAWYRRYTGDAVCVRVRAVGWVVLGSVGSEEGPSFEVVWAQPHLGTTNRK